MLSFFHIIVDYGLITLPLNAKKNHRIAYELIASNDKNISNRITIPFQDLLYLACYRPYIGPPMAN